MNALIVTGSLTLWVATAGIQGPSPAEIDEAIKAGLAGKSAQKTCSATGDNGFDFLVEGPIGRVMRAAREAKRQNREFTAENVTMAMTTSVVTVAATRDRTLNTQTREYVTPGTNFRYEADLVIKSKPSGSDPPVILKPLGPILYNTKETSGHRAVLTNDGTQPRTLPPFPGSDMTASFDLAAFKAIPHRDVEVVVFMTDTGEHKCRISEKERQAIR
jgi:hypothetical protein